MGLGEQIAAARRAKGWSQTRLAEELKVSVEAVSKWERNQYAPNREKLSRLTECLDVFAFDEKGDRKDLRFFDEEHMSAFLKGQFGAKGLTEAAAALTYAKARHAGQPRKPIAAGIPYIYHPLSLACHAMAMGLEEDTLLAALLLHDVSEDCGVAPDDLPFSPEVREIVGLVTKPKDRSKFLEKDYYAAILQNPRACRRLLGRKDRPVCERDGDLLSGAAEGRQGRPGLQQRRLAAALPDQSFAGHGRAHLLDFKFNLKWHGKKVCPLP